MNTTGTVAGPQAPSPLAAALTYASYGWQVFPVHTMRDGCCSCRNGAKCQQPAKHPWTRRGFKDGTTDTPKIKRWWEVHPDANIGIVTGDTSGIVVIDVDPRNGGDQSIKELTDRLGKLPPGPVARTGGDGWHLFFRSPGTGIKKPSGAAPGIDIKGNGGYVVGVGSVHKSGKPYLWDVPPNGSPPPALPEAWLKWLTPECYTSHTSNTSNPSDSANALIRGGRQHEADGVSLDEYVHQAIEGTAPPNVGTRRNRLFRFLTRLKRHPELSEKPVQAIRRHVQRWHKRAFHNIGTKPFADTWQDAVGAWGRIDQRPSLIEGLYRAAMAEAPPAIVHELGYADDPLTVSLAALCRALQRHHGENPFFIGYRQAADIAGTDAMTAMRRMKMLEADGVIKLVSKGGHKEGRANEYRYLGD